MIEIYLIPDTGRYCLVNSMTGNYLLKRNGRVKTYRSVPAACRARERKIKSFNKTASGAAMRKAYRLNNLSKSLPR